MHIQDVPSKSRCMENARDRGQSGYGKRSPRDRSLRRSFQGYLIWQDRLRDQEVPKHCIDEAARARTARDQADRWVVSPSCLPPPLFLFSSCLSFSPFLPFSSASHISAVEISTMPPFFPHHWTTHASCASWPGSGIRCRRSLNFVAATSRLFPWARFAPFRTPKR